MQVNRIISRNRRVPGRGTGRTLFAFRWPSGELSEPCPYSTTLNYTIRLFTRWLDLIPPAERESATAHLDAEVGKARGGLERVTLASWVGTQPLRAFLRA